MLVDKLGGVLGWLTIVLFIGTLSNYVIKFINKKWGKKIFSSPAGKKSLTFLMKVLVKNHKYFGMGAFLALFLHFVLQFLRFGLSISGVIAGILLMAQAALGAYASIKKKPRKGTWFIAHRSIAVLLILGIALHLLIPSVISLSSLSPANGSNTAAAESKVFTLEELAKYNGQDGQPAYIAYKGTVYDVSSVPQWKNGTHNGEKAGTDVTNDISKSPHGEKVFA
ncbi:MAG: cytochrome b5 domain-containing protein, partial [Clostridiaceae bacterium]|nr:cytochrome b5 domain-containing protein [Clostridiaceae bacterium]